MLWDAFRLALLAVRRNAARSLLTILGVVIGVAAVITMVHLGSGASQSISAQISSLGSNLLTIRPGQRMGPGGGSAPAFKYDDVQAISRLPGLQAVSGVANTRAVVVLGAQNWSTSITGASPPYFTASKIEVVTGRIFTDSEEQAARPVCVVGQTVREELFGAADPVGSQIRVRQFRCEVIGLLKTRGEAAMGTDQDDIIVMPLRTVQRRLTGSQDIGNIVASVAEQSQIDQAKQDITQLLRERRRLEGSEEDNFNIMDTRQIAEAVTGTTRILTMLLAAVAGVSLLVGGIGIMNIMLVSVTERTREIGVRLAIGALEGDVLLQFLIEAVTLSALGGVLGMAVAAIATAILAQVIQVPVVFDPGVNLLAFGVSVLIGVVFGIFPARRAARLDPIDALRHE